MRADDPAQGDMKEDHGRWRPTSAATARAVAARGGRMTRSSYPSSARWTRRTKGGGDGEKNGDEWKAIVARGSDALATWESIPSAKGPGPGTATKRYLARKKEERQQRQEERADPDRSSPGGGSAEDIPGRRGENGFAYLGLPPDSHEVWRDKEQEEKVVRQHGGGSRSQNLDWSSRRSKGVPGRRGENGFMYLSLPPDLHEVRSLGDRTGSEDDKGRRGENGFVYFGLPPDSHEVWRDKEQEQKVMRRHAARNWSPSDEDLVKRSVQLGEAARLKLEGACKEADRPEQEAASALEQERISATGRLEKECREAERQAITTERISASF